MRGLKRSAVSLAAVVGMSLAGLAVTAGSASAAPVCGPDMRWPGNSGEVTAQLGPTGFMQWGARDYTDNSGLWQAWVMVGSRQVDKKQQGYQPHGSVSPKDLRKGQVFKLIVAHTKLDGSKSFSRPDAQCLIP